MAEVEKDMKLQSTETSEAPIEGEAVPTNDSDAGVEEGHAAYHQGGFHPVYIGDIFNDRYEVLSKIGYGLYSTVWLVRDQQNKDDPVQAYRALKVLSGECYGAGHDTYEREILKHLREFDDEQPGYPFICHMTDDFEVQGPNGNHVCLVFELMGESLATFNTMFEENRIPSVVIQRFTAQLVLALTYAHFCDVIHTDLKPANIFVKIRDHTLIESGYLALLEKPKQDKDEERYTPIPSIPLRGFYFNEWDGRHPEGFDVAIGDWGVSSWTANHLTEKIQPLFLRSPEVLLRAPWDMSTDWWNLGAVLHEVYRAIRMFTGQVPPDGHYEVKEHIAEIINYFGPIPKELRDKADQELVNELFSEDGTLKDPFILQRVSMDSEDFCPGLEPDIREEYLSFLKMMMKLNPEERPGFIELLEHPWMCHSW